MAHAIGCATPLAGQAAGAPVEHAALVTALESGQHAQAKDDEEDLRANWIGFDEHGVRFKAWRQVLAESTTERHAAAHLRA